jgi:hypothetical protein
VDSGIGGGGVVVAKKAGRVTMARIVGGCKYGDSGDRPNC